MPGLHRWLIAIFFDLLSAAATRFRALEEWLDGRHNHALGYSTAWSRDSEALVVLIHGLFAWPAQIRPLENALKRMLENHPRGERVDVRTPPVPKHGATSMAVARAPIAALCRSWIRHTRGKGTIILIGHSNGAALAFGLYGDLRLEVERMHVLSSAGATAGTRLITAFPRLMRLRLPRVVYEEMAPMSPKRRQVILRAVIAGAKRGHDALAFHQGDCDLLLWDSGREVFEWYGERKEFKGDRVHSTIHEGCGHALLQYIQGEVVEWVADRLGRRP